MKFRQKIYFSLFLIEIGIYFEFSECCPLPLTAGDWLSTSRGTWTISSDGNTVENFRADLTLKTPVHNLTCDSNGTTPTQYILQTNLEFNGVYIKLYICLDIRSTDNSNRYLFYIVTPPNPTAVDTFKSDRASACSSNDYLDTSNIHMLIFNFINVAVSQNAIQQNTLVYPDVGNPGSFAWTADKAVDDCILQDDPNTQKCCSASLVDISSDFSLNHWTLTLAGKYAIEMIKLYARSDQNMDNQLQDFQLYLSEEVGGTEDLVTMAPTEDANIYTFSFMPPRNVSVITIRRPTQNLILICELQAFAVCDAGFHGPNCAMQCGGCLDNAACDRTTGICPGDCEPGYHSETCTPCGNCLSGEACNSTTGICPNGCAVGWEGDLCVQACTNNTYGSNCGLTCGNCINGAQCNHVNGSCESGCDPGWAGELCIMACSENMYGQNCNESCGKCLEGAQCHHVDGTCEAGCAPGWLGQLCTAGCAAGSHGINCTEQCGNCLDDEVCNAETGFCPRGCAPGWKGGLCTKECDNGTFGANCASRCYCADNVACNKTTGQCPAGCAPGYMEESCHSECESGRYGQDCNITCGQCNTGSCDHEDGRCDSGCAAGYKETTCQEGCAEGEHGENCAEDCGNCKTDTVCDAMSGSCPNGCEDGYLEPLCVATTHSGAGSVRTIVGGILGGIGVFVLLLTI